MVQGDIGGFGFGSDFSYSLAVGAVYRLSDSIRRDLKVEGLWVDYEGGNRATPGYFNYDTATTAQSSAWHLISEFLAV